MIGIHKDVCVSICCVVCLCVKKKIYIHYELCTIRSSLFICKPDSQIQAYPSSGILCCVPIPQDDSFEYCLRK